MTISTIIHVTKEVLTDGRVVHPETEHPTNSGNLSMDVNKLILLYILFFYNAQVIYNSNISAVIGVEYQIKEGFVVKFSLDL